MRRNLPFSNEKLLNYCGEIVGHNVRADYSVDGHIRILCGMWPLADRYVAL